jgi:putative endonuclease
VSSVDKGRQGEDLAVKYLGKNGYKILERNFRSKLGEIDIIAREKKDIVFIEVKTRSSADFGYPEESVGRQKQERIKNCASFYLQKKNINLPVRFEVLSILKKKEKISFKIIPFD